MNFPLQGSLYNENENDTQYNHFYPMVRNGWIVKFSVQKNQDASSEAKNILIVITSRYTAQTLIRYFDKEPDAVEYIKSIILTDATVIDTTLYSKRSTGLNWENILRKQP